MNTIGLRPMNLLIIDDDNICTYINTRVAASSGLFSHIRSVDSGEKALDIFRRAHTGKGTAPDVILLDLNMPRMHGFDFIQELRKIEFPNKEHLGIIIVTSSVDDRDLRRARELGVEHYLIKNLTAKALHTTIFELSRKMVFGSR